MLKKQRALSNVQMGSIRHSRRMTMASAPSIALHVIARVEPASMRELASALPATMENTSTKIVINTEVIAKTNPPTPAASRRFTLEVWIRTIRYSQECHRLRGKITKGMKCRRTFWQESSKPMSSPPSTQVSRSRY